MTALQELSDGLDFDFKFAVLLREILGGIRELIDLLLDAADFFFPLCSALLNGFAALLALIEAADQIIQKLFLLSEVEAHIGEPIFLCITLCSQFLNFFFSCADGFALLNESSLGVA